MYSFKIYIEGQELELFKDETVKVSSSVQNIKDVSKVFTDFSQSFTVPASQVNNTIFSHWYNIDIVGGFDARSKVDATIELNHIEFKKGKVRLNKVNTENGTPVSYNIQFFGLLVTLVDLFKDDYLSDLDLSTFNHTYDFTNVNTGLSTGLSSGSIIYPLISPVKRWYYNSATDVAYEEKLANIDYSSGVTQGILWSELKPAILVTDVIDAIEAKYGLTLSADFIGTEPFDDLYVWCSREKGYLANPSNGNEKLINWTSETGTTDFIDITTDRFSEVVEWEVDGAEEDETYYTYSIEIVPTVGTIEYNIIIRDADKNNSIVASKMNVTGTQTLSGQIHADTVNQLAQSFDIGFYISSADTITYSATVDIDETQVVFGSADTVTSDDYTAASDSLTGTLNVASFLPKMKVIDFFQGIVKKYNLVIIPTTETNLFIDTLDNWYGDGTTHDITKYIVKDKFTISRMRLPSDIEFKYQEPQTLISLNHLETFDEVYGDLLYSDDNVDLDGGTLEIELPFEQMKYERQLDVADDSQTDIQIGYSVDKDEEPELTEAHLFYGLNQSMTGKTIALLNDTGTPTEKTTAFMPFHGNTITTPAHSTLWGSDLNEWDGVSITNSLFNKYYKDYIRDLFNSTRRTFNFKAQLPVPLLSSINLNDVLFIEQRAYIINNMNQNLTSGQVDLELLNVVGVTSVAAPAPPTESYILDTYTATTAYSLRQLKTGITNVVRVVRSSDSAELDFTPTEITDGTLTTWTGANNGNVVTWYDQSGNGLNLTEATNPPIIVNSGTLVTENGKPAIDFNGTNQKLQGWLSATAPVIMQDFSEPQSHFIVHKPDVVSTSGVSWAAGRSIMTIRVDGASYDVPVSLGISSSKLSHGAYDGSIEVKSSTSTYVINTQYLSEDHIDSSYVVTMYVNNSSDGGGTLTLANSDKSLLTRTSTMLVGARTTNTTTFTSFYDGAIQEYILFKTDQTANRAAIATDINTHYSIY